MEFEPGSELGPADELRQAKIAARRMSAVPKAWEWEWYEWSVGLRWAKTAVIEAEKEVQQFAVSWAVAWARAEARAWVEIKAKLVQLTGSGWGREATMALLVGEAWGEARAQARGECVPDRLADPPTIANILTFLNRHGVTHHFWRDSLEMREGYWCIIQSIAPITRLPIELLHQIFLVIIEETSGSPLALMLVCKRWHAIVTSIWSSLNLTTTTPIDAIARKLERDQWFLDIVVDTDSDHGDFTPSGGAFEAMFAAIEATPRWRSFVVNSFPAQADLPEDLVNRHLQRHSNATMSRFTTFKIKSTCETSPLLNGLLCILGTTAGPVLTTVEINSTNVISFLTPAYSSFFHSVKVLSISLDAPGIHDPVDLLPHLHQLETFTVSHLSFPTYLNHVELPFVRTLQHLSLRAASIQWMSGRTFHVLEHCTLIFPRHQNNLHTFHTTLPNCGHLTFQGYPLKVLGGVSAHKLNHLSVTCSGSFNRQGSQQLVWFAGLVLGEHKLAPKSLHISIQATSQAWMSSLVFMSDLEELVIHCAEPLSLGARVFQSLVVHPVQTRNMGMMASPGELGAPLCPSLRRFVLKYDRWLRQGEQFDLIPVLVSFIQSRQHSNYALESFDIWATSEQTVPLELIKRSQMHLDRLRWLAEVRIGKHLWDSTAMRLTKVTSKPSGEAILPTNTFPSPDGHLFDIPQLGYGQLATLQQLRQEEYPAGVHPVQKSGTTNFSPLTLKSVGDYHYYRNHVTSRISLNRKMGYKGVILAPALPNESQLVLRCRAECRSCSNATSTTSPRGCSLAAFDLEPLPDLKSDRPFELKFRQDKPNGPLFADMTFLIQYRPIVPKNGDQEWCCRSGSLLWVCIYLEEPKLMEIWQINISFP